MESGWYATERGGGSPELWSIHDGMRAESARPRPQCSLSALSLDMCGRRILYPAGLCDVSPKYLTFQDTRTTTTHDFCLRLLVRVINMSFTCTLDKSYLLIKKTQFHLLKFKRRVSNTLNESFRMQAYGSPFMYVVEDQL